MVILLLFLFLLHLKCFVYHFLKLALVIHKPHFSNLPELCIIQRKAKQNFETFHLKEEN